MIMNLSKNSLVEIRNFKIFYSILFVVCLTNIYSQDTIIKIKSSWYGRTMPVSIYTGAGSLSDKISQNVEVGRSFGVVDIGLVFGQINQRADSNKYAEFKVTMDACQYGIFSNELSIGIGKVFKSRTPIMLEMSYSVFAQVYKKWGLGVITGYYDFGGVTTDMSKTFYGIFIRYGLLRAENGGLLNKKMRGHHHR